MSNIDQLPSELGSPPLPGFIEITVDAVAKHAPTLIGELALLDVNSTVAQISGLLTVPEFHANTLRLEVLAHLAVTHCVGSGVPTRNQLMHWLNESLAPFAHLEDPLEDVFVTNVATDLGNYRLFEGLWESADFWTQQVLDVLARIPDNPYGTKLRRHVGALLQVSEAVASRADVDRLTTGAGTPKAQIPVPGAHRLVPIASRVLFEPKELERLDVQFESLRPFLLPNNRSDMQNDVIGRSTLERSPLLLDGDNILVAIPSAISVAIRRYVLEECDRLRLTVFLQSALRLQQGGASF
jgi:hypothetical protein